MTRVVTSNEKIGSVVIIVIVVVVVVTSFHRRRRRHLSSFPGPLNLFLSSFAACFVQRQEN